MSIQVLDACGHCLYIDEEIISGTSEKWSKGSRTSIKYNTPITIDHRSWRKKRFPTGLTFILWIVKHTKLKQRTRILTACHLGLHSCSGTNRKKLENERNFKRNTKLSNKVTETSVLTLKCLKSNVLLFILWIAFIAYVSGGFFQSAFYLSLTDLTWGHAVSWNKLAQVK